MYIDGKEEEKVLEEVLGELVQEGKLKAANGSFSS